MKHITLACALMLVIVAGPALAKEYSVLLNLGGSAQSDKGTGQMGEWTFADGGVVITWTDGTQDRIRKGPDGYEKIASSNSGKSASSGAEKVK